MTYKIDSYGKCAVIGHGSWATALVKILLENENQVHWYIRNPKVLEHLRHKGNNPKYLRDVHFDSSKLVLHEDIRQAVSEAAVVIVAVPSAFVKSVLEPLEQEDLKGRFLVSAVKGIIAEDYLTVTEFLTRKYSLGYDHIGVVSGPCHSEEVALERLSYLTIVSKYVENARILCDKFSTDYIRANPSTDIYGAEYASVLKNIYAVCAGIAVGLGYGDNFLSVLVANAALEMNRFLSESYDHQRDICESAYLGDLMVTCYSQFSRNRTFGAMIGKGYRIEAAQAEMNMIAEGYNASRCMNHINMTKGIRMPIADCVYKILHEQAAPAPQMEELTKHLI